MIFLFNNNPVFMCTAQGCREFKGTVNNAIVLDNFLFDFAVAAARLLPPPHHVFLHPLKATPIEMLA